VPGGPASVGWPPLRGELKVCTLDATEPPPAKNLEGLCRNCKVLLVAEPRVAARILEKLGEVKAECWVAVSFELPG